MCFGIAVIPPHCQIIQHCLLVHRALILLLYLIWLATQAPNFEIAPFNIIDLSNASRSAIAFLLDFWSVGFFRKKIKQTLVMLLKLVTIKRDYPYVDHMASFNWKGVLQEDKQSVSLISHIK
ncbi:MAG: hypothetical protein EXX96DRAFT_612850 [Benjaminiella poitrasii]|nr:MAG: hypothetical protein EXX96DRAFT_612850 [Benjaminiella poitrasii]